MRFTCSVEIDKPINEVVDLFKNPGNLKEWQDGFVSMEVISGEIGEVGSKTKFVYKTGGGKIDLIETIKISNLPEEFTALYEARQMVNTMSNKFKSLNEKKTIWNAEIEYISFHGFIPKLMAKLMPGMFKKQTQKWLDQFKIFAEKS